MSSELELEVLLFAFAAAVWLWPAAVAIRRGYFSLIHPTGFFPLFFVFTLAVALSEHWFGWSGRGSPGLRFETRLMYGVPKFFIDPLLIVIAVSVAYYFGLRLARMRIVPNAADVVHLRSAMRPFRSGNATSVALTCMGAWLVLWVPFLTLGQSSGFFWTTALLFAANFVPLIAFEQSRFTGYCLYAAGWLTIGIYGSKGDAIYYVLPVLLFRQHTLIKGRGYRFFGKVVLFCLMCYALLNSTTTIVESRGESDQALWYKILVREYGFETFAHLVEKSTWLGASDGVSWLGLELREMVPASFAGPDKQRAGIEVARVLMPSDFRIQSTSSFYRFFVFAAYHDFGIPGALAFGALFGYCVGRLYRKALKLTVLKRESWPLIAYTSIAVFSQFFVNGVFSFGIIYSAAAAALILGLRFIHTSSARELAVPLRGSSQHFARRAFVATWRG